MGALFDAARATAARAGDALEPLATEVVPVEDEGLRFEIHVLRSLARKPRGPSPVNPFLPPDPALVVGDWPPDHRVVLNKFPVFRDHLLVVTRAFLPQDAPLDPADLEAARTLLDAEDGLLFYNGGTVAGASQPHRHLQLVPCPLGGGPGRFPAEAGLADGRLPAVSAPTPAGADELYRVYRALLGRLGDAPGYNLLATRERVTLVPRVAEGLPGISVNALGFAGSLLVKDHAGLERLLACGPLRLLRMAAGVG